ncbi:MAG: peptidylprolyl isomerase [Azoarcus sp.]|jgi:hypothetical protein|nr:peptidylprolyl isomerase [Azoarcus sp.]
MTGLGVLTEIEEPVMPTAFSPIVLSLALLLSTPLALAQTPAPSSATPQTPAKPAAAKSSNKPYLTVNGYAIPQHTVDNFIAEQKARGLDTSTAAFRQAIREEMIRRGALLAEAKKQSLDKRPEYKRQLELSAQVLLMRDVVAEHIKRHPVTDADMDAAYRDALARLGNSKYKLRHIQSKTEADAKDIIAKLNDGKKFDKLLKQSTDETTRDQGGNLGWKIPVACRCWPPTTTISTNGKATAAPTPRPTPGCAACGCVPNKAASCSRARATSPDVL